MAGGEIDRITNEVRGTMEQVCVAKGLFVFNPRINIYKSDSGEERRGVIVEWTEEPLFYQFSCDVIDGKHRTAEIRGGGPSKIVFSESFDDEELQQKLRKDIDVLFEDMTAYLSIEDN